MENLWKDVHLSSLHQDPTIKTPLNEKTKGQDQNPKEVLGSVSTPVFMSSLNTPFEALGFSASSSASSSSPRSMFDCFYGKNKRVADDPGNTEDLGVDRKHKRMMKNRESAARSRARRQAYTSELEREIAELMEDNANLRKQQVELLISSSSSTAAAGMPKKSSHSRSLTAPF